MNCPVNGHKRRVSCLKQLFWPNSGYRTQLPSGIKYMWFLQVMGAPLPKSGTADTLDEATSAIEAAYERVRSRST
jgi:hypothetical protein